MKSVRNSSESIGIKYPHATGRLKLVGNYDENGVKVALAGDSTQDNGYWVDRGVPYAEKRHTVTHQTAYWLAQGKSKASFANYLWRAAMNDNFHISLRITAGVIAAPILLSKIVLGLALMLVLSLPIYGYHKLIGLPEGSAINFNDRLEDQNNVPETDRDPLQPAIICGR